MTVQERTKSAQYERTFVVAVHVARAWAAFVEPREREAWMVPPGRDPIEKPDIAYPADDFPPTQFEVQQVEPNRLLRWREGPHADPPAWLEVSVTFEDIESGTRISITRSGFGDSDEWTRFTQSTALGWDESIADLICYLETGVRAGRHFGEKSSVGASMIETGAGVRIAQAIAGGFAAEAGLRPGDLILRLAGASVVRRSDVWALERAHRAGDPVDVDYVRDRQVLRGRAPLSAHNYTETHGATGA